MPILTDASLPEEEVKFMGSRAPKEPPPEDPSSSSEEEEVEQGAGSDGDETPLVIL